MISLEIARDYDVSLADVNIVISQARERKDGGPLETEKLFEEWNGV